MAKRKTKESVMKFEGSKKALDAFLGMSDATATDHMLEDLERENRRKYFAGSRKIGVGKKLVAWSIAATVMLMGAIAYNLYLLSVIGGLVARSI